MALKEFVHPKLLILHSVIVMKRTNAIRTEVVFLFLEMIEEDQIE
ncbi:MAG: hypothetical protein ACJA1C_002495 [Crocinitomicaceae bacterium]|jgi:hypothetical protein